jgi:hypothetical protein
MRTRSPLLILACAFALSSWTLTLRAQTNASPSEPSHEKDKKHGLELRISDEDELPKDIADKLTSDQLYQLMLQRAQHPNSDIPGQVPLIVAIVFGCPVAIVAIILYYRHRKNRLLHDTLAKAIEKGAPIPPELLAPDKPRKSDLRRGLTLVAIGVGVTIFFVAEREDAWGLGMIPLLIGIGYLIAWKLEQKKQMQ